MSEQRPDRELVDIAWVAARLGVNVRMVRRLVSERRIPHLKVGGHVRFDPAEVERFIEGCRRPTRDEGDDSAALTSVPVTTTRPQARHRRRQPA